MSEPVQVYTACQFVRGRKKQDLAVGFIEKMVYNDMWNNVPSRRYL